MRLPRQLFIVAGSAAVIASIAMAALSFSSLVDTSVEAVGDFTAVPSATQGPAKTHTPTPRATEAPTEAPEVTNTVPPAPTTAPPTNTPSGGAGAGVQPPNTGTGDGGSGSSLQWLLVAGSVAVLAGGIGSLGYGLRRP